MDYLYEYGLFLAQAVTIVAALLVLIGGIASIAMRQKAEQHEWQVEHRF